LSTPSAVEAPPRGRLPERDFSAYFLRLREDALEWIGDYYDGEHLRRAADWLLALEPDAAEPLVLAVLTHDMERVVPGGPLLDKARTPWDDPAYNRLHCERSAEVVAGWLRERNAPEHFVRGVQVPIKEHEFGGSEEGDLAQAADSLSWLEVNSPLALSWVERGECDLGKAEAKLDWMLARIRIDRAREPAARLHEQAMARLRAGASRSQ
jgi:hypothetical protein